MSQQIQDGAKVTVQNNGGDPELDELVGKTGTVEQTGLFSAEVRLEDTSLETIPKNALQVNQ